MARSNKSYSRVTGRVHSLIHSCVMSRARREEPVFEHEVEKRDAVMEEGVRGRIILQGVDGEF